MWFMDSPCYGLLVVLKISSFSSSALQDFKSILEFELSIVREQNRLQMLQLQKKMEHNLSNQLKLLRDDTVKQLAAFRNEVNNRLTFINDSVVSTR